MFSKKVLQELMQATSRYPGGFVVLEENRPKFVIMDYSAYQRLSVSQKTTGAVSLAPSLQSGRKPRVLVTGGAGYIGSHTARLLLRSGYEVTTFDNLSTGFREFAQGALVEGDLSDPVALERVFEQGKFDAVVHFAASIEVEESVKDPLKYYRNNVACGINLLEAMRQYGVKNIVFSSTCTVYEDAAVSPIDESARFGPTSPYAETKLVFENLLRASAVSEGLSSVILRYFNAAGASLDGSLGSGNPHPTHLIPNVLNVAMGMSDQLTVFGNDYHTHDGTAIRDYIHVEDLAQAHLLALNKMLGRTESEPYVEAFNVGTGRGFTVLEVINAVIERTGHMVKFEFGPRRAGDREQVVANPAKIKRELGFEPQYSDLNTIIDTAWAWHKKRFGSK